MNDRCRHPKFTTQVRIKSGVPYTVHVCLMCPAWFTNLVSPPPMPAPVPEHILASVPDPKKSPSRQRGYGKRKT